MAATAGRVELVSKFRGCMVGALMGDCLGSPFEGMQKVSRSVVNNYFAKLNDTKFRTPYKNYTDDTAMMRCVAQSLISRKEFDPQDMAKKFVSEYYAQPRRGYGMNVVDVFAALRIQKCEEPYLPAKAQFGGTGSFGNGGAMRVAPVALFCYNNFDFLVDVAMKSALLTHANRNGYNGAILQCIAVHQALQLQPVESLSFIKFTEDLIEKMKKIELNTEENTLGDHETVDHTPFVSKLHKILNYMEREKPVADYEVQEELGVNISALGSVPTAIYCFLRAQNEIPDIQVKLGEADEYVTGNWEEILEGHDVHSTDSLFQRTIQYAITLGGDTDTIASMAGSIAGAYLGLEAISPTLMKHCESAEEAIMQGEQLYELLEK